jgi:charged multivesicular body protein 1
MSGLEKALFNLKVCRDLRHSVQDPLTPANSSLRSSSIARQPKLAKMSRPRKRSWRRHSFALAHHLWWTHSWWSGLQAIQQGHADIAKIYAQNAIRKQNEKLNLLRLGSRIDAVSSRVQTAVTMRQVTGSMANVVKGMDGAMKAMDLEKVGASNVVYWFGKDDWPLDQISAVMDRFETQFEDLDVATGYYENATSQATATATPQDDVDKLMSQVADEAGVELSQEMNSTTPANDLKAQPEEEREDKLGERLRALRAG